MSMFSSMIALHLFGHNDKNEVKHDYVIGMPLAPVLALHGANGIENDIMLFLWAR